MRKLYYQTKVAPVESDSVVKREMGCCAMFNEFRFDDLMTQLSIALIGRFTGKQLH
jgi:hypothetical protein